MTYAIRFSFGSNPSPIQGGWLTFAGEMPALNGSEKQVAWATEIRARMARELAEYLASGLKIKVGTPLQSETAFITETEAKFDAALSDPKAAPMLAAATKLFGTASAKYWIDNRSRAIQVLVNEASKG